MKRNLVAILAIVAAVFIVYRDVHSAYFFEDDFQWLAGALTYAPSSLVDVFGSGRSHFYRPVVELYFWIATPLFGGSPRLFHLASVVLHAANGVLLHEFYFTGLAPDPANVEKLGRLTAALGY